MTRHQATTALATSSSSSSSETIATAAPPPLDPANVESDFVVILAALLCALICVVGLIAVARCAWLRRATGGGRPRQQPSANKGVKKKVLQSLPKFTFNASSPNTKFAAECAICLGEFVEGDEVRVLPQCGHAFHISCVDTWLGSHSSCPSCRQILVARCQKCGGIPEPSGSGSGFGSGSGSGSCSVELKGGGRDIEEGRCNSDGFLP